MGMPDCLFLVRARVDPEVEDGWNRWYNNIHLPEILACPGFLSVRRYVCESGEGRTYIACYEIEGPEAVESPEFAERRGWADFKERVSATTEVYMGITGVRQI